MWLGVDAGGTRTVAVAIGPGERELARAEAGPGNPLAVGDERALESLRSAVSFVLDRLGDRHPDAVHFGIAGAGRLRDAERARTLIGRLHLACPVGLSDDAAVSFYAGADPPGVVLVAGTGSIAVAYGTAGRAWRSGGHGHLVGDEGSAYWIGREAVRAALRAADGRAPESGLAELVMEHMGAGSLEDVVTRLYSAQPDRAALAALAPAVLASEDPAARAIAQAAAGELAALARAAITSSELGAGRAEFPVVLAGGLLVHDEGLRQRVSERITRAVPLARPAVLRRDAALGAARLAAGARAGGD